MLRIRKYIVLVLILLLITHISVAGSGSTDNFIIKIKTDNPGTSDVNEFTIPTTGTGYNYNVDCDNDGIEEAVGVTSNYTCVYQAIGNYNISINDATGNFVGFPRIHFNNQGDRRKILDIIQWGNGKWTSMENSFYGAENMIVSANDTPNFTAVTSVERMFYNATSANPNTSNWNTSNITNMKEMFRSATLANPDTSNWNTSNVTNMDTMFGAATSAKPITINWNTVNVTNMNQLFAFATLANPDTSNWNTSNVTNMAGMFNGATSANPDTSNWNTSNVTNMHSMFSEATSANPDTSNWDTSNVENMILMFADATIANPDTSNWDISQVTNMSSMFSGVTLPTADYDAMLTGFNAQTLQPSVSFHGGNSTYCAVAAHDNLTSASGHNWTIVDGGDDPNCNAVPADDFVITVKTDNIGSSSDLEFTIPTTGSGYNYNVDCNNDDTNETTGATGDYTCTYPVAGTYTVRIKDNTGNLDGFPRIYFNNQGDKEKIIDIVQWGNNKWTSMDSAFYGAENMSVSATDEPVLVHLTSLRRMFYTTSLANPNTTNWDTSNVTNMNGMFKDAVFAIPDTSLWNTSNVTNIGYMFSGATLANPDTSNWNTANIIGMFHVFAGATSANPNTSNWDTSNAENMWAMFSEATSANPDTSNWDTSSATSMWAMFSGATAANPDTSNWNTANVISMIAMFDGAISANPDTSSWNTHNVTNMSYMFSGATVATPDTSNWNTANVTTMEGMFDTATSANPDTSTWDTSNVINMSAMFDGAISANPDTSNWNISLVLTMSDMFSGVTLPTADYDAMLTGFNAQTLQPNIFFDGGNSTYCAVTAHDNLTSASGHNWTIVDGGVDPNCDNDMIFRNGFELPVTKFNAIEKQFLYDFSLLEGIRLDTYPELIAIGYDENHELSIKVHIRMINKELQIRLSRFYQDKFEGYWLVDEWQTIYNNKVTTVSW